MIVAFFVISVSYDIIFILAIPDTLIQTRKIKPIPVILFGKDFWQRVIRFDLMVEEGTISPGDVNLFQYVETAEEAWRLLSKTDSLNQEGKT